MIFRARVRVYGFNEGWFNKGVSEWWVRLAEQYGVTVNVPLMVKSR